MLFLVGLKRKRWSKLTTRLSGSVMSHHEMKKVGSIYNSLIDTGDV